jgi:FKBP-type peptidyl-prolyl cis-trans isomerase FkpA
MNRISIFLILFCVCSIGLHAQNKKVSSPKKVTKAEHNYSKTANGLEYRIIKDSTSKEFPESGGYITFWFLLQNDKDSILNNQIANPNPVAIPTPEVLHKASIEEGLLLLTEGDSAIFLLNSDSLYTNTFRQPRPGYVKPNSPMKMTIRMGKIYSKKTVDSLIAVQEKQTVGQTASQAEVDTKDSIAIQDYLSKNHLTGLKTPSGSYVVILKTSTTSAAPIRSGEEIEATYIGKLLVEGTEFDRSPAGEYFKFRVGQRQVINGWDEGFQKLKHGDKALILIPSRSGYGSRGAGGAIPPNAPLLFEVEVK